MKILDNSIFRGVEKEKLDKALKKVKYRIESYDKGETVAFRGDEVTELMILLKGALTAEMQKETGEHIIIEELKEGQIVASAFIFGKNNFFPVDVVCKTAVEIFCIQKSELLKLFQFEMDILKNYLDDISTKTQFLSQRIWFDFKNKTLIEKLRTYILKNLEDGQVKFDISLKELAGMFGVARPSLSRCISNLVDEGILERIGRNHYKLIDEEAFMNKE